MLSSCSIKKKKKKLEQRAISTNFRLHRYSTLFSNRIHPPLAIFYFLLCMIPVTLQTSTKPVNRETYVTEVARFIPLIYIYGGGSTSIIVFHASAFFFFFFFGRHTIELSTFLIRFIAQKIILRSCGAMASAASTTRP